MNKETQNIEQNTRTDTEITNSSDKIFLFLHFPKATSPWVCSRFLSVLCYPKDFQVLLLWTNQQITIITALPRLTTHVPPTHFKALGTDGRFPEWERIKKFHTNNPSLWEKPLDTTALNLEAKWSKKWRPGVASTKENLQLWFILKKMSILLEKQPLCTLKSITLNVNWISTELQENFTTNWSFDQTTDNQKHSTIWIVRYQVPVFQQEEKQSKVNWKIYLYNFLATIFCQLQMEHWLIVKTSLNVKLTLRGALVA